MTSDNLNQIGALIDKKLTSTEEKLKKEISSVEERLEEKLTAVKDELLTSDKRTKDDIGSFMEDTLLPMIYDRLDEMADKADVDRIERKLDKVFDTNLDHERRITDIESVPVIAHELKHRKPKQL